MQKYPVRASHRSNLVPERIAEICRSYFDTATREGDRVQARFGAISNLSLQANGRELEVELSMDPKVGDDVARETISRYNRFLEEATGYSAKERARRIRKSAPG